VELAGDVLTIDLDLSLQTPAAVPVPSMPQGWRATDISLDGEAVGFLYRDRTQIAWLSVPAGVHRVTLRGALPAGNSATVPFPLSPRRIEVEATGWDVSGVGNGRL